jgi:hypothetical protein
MNRKQRRAQSARKPTRQPIRVNLPNGRHYLADARYPTYADYERAGEQAFWEVMNEDDAALDMAKAIKLVAAAKHIQAKTVAKNEVRTLLPATKPTRMRMAKSDRASKGTGIKKLPKL